MIKTGWSLSIPGLLAYFSSESPFILWVSALFKKHKVCCHKFGESSVWRKPWIKLQTLAWDLKRSSMGVQGTGTRENQVMQCSRCSGPSSMGSLHISWQQVGIGIEMASGIFFSLSLSLAPTRAPIYNSQNWAKYLARICVKSLSQNWIE